MYIQHKEYLALLDEIDYLKKDNTLLREQNSILISQLAKEQDKRLQLQANHTKSMKMVEQLHAKAIAYQVEQKQQIMQRITEMQTQTKQYLEKKFTNLQNSSLTQVKSLEIQNAKTKLNYYELIEFVNKIRWLYNITLGIDGVKHKKEATLMEMIKWIKSIPGVAVNLTKSGFTTSMSTTNMKKQTLNKSMFKENRSMLNSSQSKSRIKY